MPLEKITFLCRQVNSLLLALAAQAQNYSLFPKDERSYFSDGKEVYILKTDSIKNENSIDVYYPMKQPFGLYPCYNTHTWISNNKVVKFSANDSSYVSKVTVDQNGGTTVRGLLLKTKAQLNEEWVAASLGGSIKLLAHVSEWKKVSFLGVEDSVKTFRFKLSKDTSASIYHLHDSLYYKISKGYGLVETKLVEQSQEKGVLKPKKGVLGNIIKIIGLENKDLGFQVMTNKEIYDFEIGDEFHSVSKNYSGIFPFETNIDTTVKIILAKTQLVDSVKYSVYINRHTYNSNAPMEFKNMIFKDTIIEKFKLDIPSNKQINKLTGSNQEMIQWLDFSNDNTVHRLEKSSGITSCLGSPMTYTPIVEYRKGVLGTKYYVNGGSSPSTYSKSEVVYYRKGNIEYETPLVLGTEDATFDNSYDVTISPNPASGVIHIKTPRQGLASLQLFDLSGKECLFSKNIALTNTAINIQSLTKGLYIYQISTSDGKIVKGKLVVE